jgi:hypothetical protein
MGTRSTTKIYEDGRLLLALYKQYDGYPDRWGMELKKFFHKGIFVNGISKLQENLQFNGVGAFVLLLVKEFKEGTGDLYATTEEDEQEYNYVIEFNHCQKNYGKIKYSISCKEDTTYFEEGQINTGGARIKWKS